MPYRKGGWTVRQVVHHLADSHMNAYIRMKLAVTEPAPVIKPYEEDKWAKTEDGKNGSVKTSMKLLSALHARWHSFMASLSEEDLERGYFHPESQKLVLLPEAIALYAWHSQHHLAHIKLVLDGKARSAASKNKTKASSEQKAGASTDAPAKRRRRTKTEVAAKTEKPAAAEKGKRSMSPEHKEKIRIAMLARKNAAAQTAPASAPADTNGKRKRRTKAEIEAAKAVKAAAPAKPKRKGMPPEHMAKIREARMAQKAAANQPAKTSAPANQPDTSGKRKRRTKAEMEAAKAAKAAAPDKPKRKGMPPEHMAKIREARIAKRAAAGLPTQTSAPASTKPEAPAKRPRRSKAEIEAAATSKDLAPAKPKRTGRTAEQMAKARAARKPKTNTNQPP